MFKYMQFLISKSFQKNLSVEDILIRSSNIGTLLYAEKLEKINTGSSLNLVIC